MDFATYMTKLPPAVDKTAKSLVEKSLPGKADRKARSGGKQRDPFVTTKKRILAGRLVEQAERTAGKKLDFAKEKWPDVVIRLGKFQEADWRALKTTGDIIPLKKSRGGKV